jgi:hypothetical protein
MAKRASDVSVRAILIEMAWKWLDLAELNEWDSWEKTRRVRDIQTNIGLISATVGPDQVGKSRGTLVKSASGVGVTGQAVFFRGQGKAGASLIGPEHRRPQCRIR